MLWLGFLPTPMHATMMALLRDARISRTPVFQAVLCRFLIALKVTVD